jgi:dihydrodipicolinate synthase/N-acetylneuraminate lyase
VGRGGQAAGDAGAPGRLDRRASAQGRAAPLRALRGALAASVTPLGDHGSTLDDDAFGLLADFFVDAGLDGILALGTAGEGISLRVEERRRAADLFLQAADNRLQVAVHCGAQTTADTVTLAAHAAEVGADAVVVIGPPYFKLDEKAQYAHFLAATSACAPLPFYVYEFAATTGYAVAPAVLERLRADASNVVGLKVSDTPWNRFAKYLLPGFDIFVGPEALIADGMAAGAVGAVSALASALPREVASVVRDPSSEGAARLGELRAFVERFPRQAALKRLLALQGVPVKEDVRAPLRPLTADERDELDAWADSVLDYAESNSS